MGLAHKRVRDLVPGDTLRDGATVVRTEPATFPRGWVLLTVDGGRWAAKSVAYRPTDMLLLQTDDADVAVPDGGCVKCSGTGRIDGFAHVQDGVCFACDGTGRAS